jgi:hydroxyethylthiazole kinase-like uncharacterized protein yjeF
MEQITKQIFSKLYKPPLSSHKGQNGKLTIIGGSKLFHGASLWSLKIASRIVDMVFYSTVEENKQVINKLKSELFDFICVPRSKIEDYINQSDAVLIGPGLVRGTAEFSGTGETGEETKVLTKKLLEKFPNKKWVIDAGSLQVMDPAWLLKLKEVIITPHFGEFKNLFFQDQRLNLKVQNLGQRVKEKAKEYGCIIVLKGPQDVVCSPDKCVIDIQGNPGMTKGGTGDILAGLIAAFACKNDLFLAACAGVFTEGLAGDRLFSRVGPYYNASDLCEEIPKVLKELMGY